MNKGQTKVLIKYDSLDYGGFIEHQWWLRVYQSGAEVKSFYLGQDIKFIQRVLQYNVTSFSNLVRTKAGIKAGDSLDMDNLRIQESVAKCILSILDIKPKQLLKLDELNLCCQ